MKFNKSILVIVFAIAAVSVKAQQIPLYSNYFFTPYIYNPAMSGAKGYTEATFLHRRQWTDIQGSPETSALAINGSLNEEKVGWSMYAFSDRTDIVSKLGMYGNYAYHLKITDKMQLSFGLGFGYFNNNIDVDAIRAKDQGDVFTITNGDRGAFDLNAGLNFKIADFQIGAAAPQLLASTIEYARTPTTEVDYQLIRHYVFNAQYDFKFSGDKNVLTPLVVVRAAKYVPVQVDAGLMFNMEGLGFIGAMFRSEYAVTANVGVNLSEQLTIGYAYDFSLNEYGSELGTSHEFMLGYRFGSNKRNERMENEIKKLKTQQRKAKAETEELVDEKLEEFKDEYKREIEKEFKEAAEAAAAAAALNATQNAGQNQGGNNQGQNNQNAGGNQNQQGQGGDNGGQNANQGTFDPGSSANNVAPGSAGYYIVAGVFSNKANADRLQRKLESQGVQARSFQDPGNFYYYVYLRKYDTYKQAEQAKASNLNGSFSGDLWIKSVK